MANFPTNAATGSIFSTGTNVYRYVGHNQWETISPNIAVGYSEMDQSITGSIETFENTGASAPSTLSANSLQLDGAHDTSSTSAFSVVGSVSKLSSEAQFFEPTLHLKMEGTNNTTTFTDSSRTGHTATSVGGAKNSTGQAMIGETSAYFDATDDYIKLSDHEDFEFGAGDFTIGGWLYPTNIGSNNRHWISKGWVSAQGGGDVYSYRAFNGLITPAGKLSFAIYNGPTNSDDLYTETSSALSNNNWYHFAIVRIDGTIKIYLNGVLEATQASTGTINATTAEVHLGSAFWSTGGGNWNASYQGYIDDFRIYKGLGKYTAAFSVDQRPGQALPTDAPKLKIQSKYNNVLTSYKINMTKDKE